MFKRAYAALALSLALAGGLSRVLRAETPPGPRAIPPLAGPVMDEAGILQRNQVAMLENELRAYPPALQLQIWVISSLQGEAIEALTIRAVEAWKLGTAKEDRGALVLISVGDRQMRIEVGQGLEGEIPDITAGRIIRQVLTPSFRSGDFYGGLREASRALYGAAGGDVSRLGGESAPRLRRGGKTDVGTVGLFIIAALIALLSLLGGGGGGGRRSRLRSAGLWGLGAGSGGFGGGWGGGSGGGSGGGGWSGGGGGFSGGGSSGNW